MKIKLTIDTLKSIGQLRNLVVLLVLFILGFVFFVVGGNPLFLIATTACGYGCGLINSEYRAYRGVHLQ